MKLRMDSTGQARESNGTPKNSASVGAICKREIERIRDCTHSIIITLLNLQQNEEIPLPY